MSFKSQRSDQIFSLSHILSVLLLNRAVILTIMHILVRSKTLHGHKLFILLYSIQVHQPADTAAHFMCGDKVNSQRSKSRSIAECLLQADGQRRPPADSIVWTPPANNCGVCNNVFADFTTTPHPASTDLCCSTTPISPEKEA